MYKHLINKYVYLDVEWTLYEQVAVAAMDCQSLDVAKVQSFLNEFPFSSCIKLPYIISL